VPKKELDLLEFATGEMTEPGACATEVVRSQLVYAEQLTAPKTAALGSSSLRILSSREGVFDEAALTPRHAWP
jgi:hypothetical protein